MSTQKQRLKEAHSCQETPPMKIFKGGRYTGKLSDLTKKLKASIALESLNSQPDNYELNGWTKKEYDSMPFQLKEHLILNSITKEKFMSDFELVENDGDLSIYCFENESGEFELVFSEHDFLDDKVDELSTKEYRWMMEEYDYEWDAIAAMREHLKDQLDYENQFKDWVMEQPLNRGEVRAI